MDIQIRVDHEQVVAKIEDALSRIESLRETMPAELTAWQEQDMGRSRANTSVPDAQTAVTTILPRARQMSTPRRRHRPQLLRQRRQRPAIGSSAARVLSRRSILRPELLIMLRERMTELLGKAFAWH
jgi:hypothetical protein